MLENIGLICAVLGMVIVIVISPIIVDGWVKLLNSIPFLNKKRNPRETIYKLLFYTPRFLLFLFFFMIATTLDGNKCGELTTLFIIIIIAYAISAMLKAGQSTSKEPS